MFWKTKMMRLNRPKKRYIEKQEKKKQNSLKNVCTLQSVILTWSLRVLFLRFHAVKKETFNPLKSSVYNAIFKLIHSVFAKEGLLGKTWSSLFWIKLLRREVKVQTSLSSFLAWLKSFGCIGNKYTTCHPSSLHLVKTKSGQMALSANSL